MIHSLFKPQLYIQNENCLDEKDIAVKFLVLLIINYF